MPIHADIRLKGAQQVVKTLERKAEAPHRIAKRQKNRVMSFARVTHPEHLTPGSDFLQPALDSRLIGNVIRVSSKGINGGQRIPLFTRNQVRGDGKVLIMAARQAPALRIGSPVSLELIH